MKVKDYMFAKLSQDTEFYYSDQISRMLCPCCLKFYNISQITLAHIIPKSFNGDEISLLCAKCNNVFGMKQDKWFGEYLKLASDDKSLFFDAKSKSKYIKVNGKKVRGNIKIAADGVIEVQIIHYKKEDAEEPLSSRISISQKIDLLSHEREIEVGYLTAAYLFWFYSFGYSWVLQDSLGIVRHQIHESTEQIIKEPFCINIDGFHHPCVGVIELEGALLPSVLMYDKIVYFPNANGVNSYSKISKLISLGTSDGRFTPIATYKSHKHPPFFGLVCKGQQLIIPQPFINQEMILDTILYYDGPKVQPYFMYLENTDSSTKSSMG